MGPRLTSPRPSAVLVVLLISLTLNMVQGARLRSFARADDTGPAIGTRLPALEVLGESGRQDDDPAGTSATITYYFSRSCTWCIRNWPSVAALEKQTRSRFRFRAVTGAPSSTVDLIGHGVDFPVFTARHPWQLRAYGFRGTPHTVVVSPQGQLLHSWIGAYTGGVKRDIERFFQVRLPEVLAHAK